MKMSSKKILMTIAGVPILIGGGIAVMMLSYLIVPMIIVAVALTLGYAIVSVILEGREDL